MTPATRFKVGRLPVVDRIREILRLAHAKKVLHLGCADAPFTRQRGEDLLHKRLATVTSPDRLWGVDRDREGVRLLREMGFENVLCGDCEELGAELAQQEFELVIAGEIIEHVSNPGRFLRAVSGVVRQQGRLLITTPNASSIRQFVFALLGIENVHSDHNFYYSQRTLRQLVEKSGYRVLMSEFYQEVASGGSPRIFDLVLRQVVRARPLLADGLILEVSLAPA